MERGECTSTTCAAAAAGTTAAAVAAAATDTNAGQLEGGGQTAAAAAAAARPTKSKRPRLIKRNHYGTRCICCDPRCDEAHHLLKRLEPERCAYFAIPSEPKAELAGRPRAKADRKRDRKRQRRERMLEVLGTDAILRVNDPRYSEKSRMMFGSLHLHDEVYALCPRNAKGCVSLVDSVPAALADRLTDEFDLYFGDEDMFEDDGTYVPLPNVEPRDMLSYVHDLERSRGGDYAAIDQRKRPPEEDCGVSAKAEVEDILAEGTTDDKIDAFLRSRCEKPKPNGGEDDDEEEDEGGDDTLYPPPDATNKAPTSKYTGCDCGHKDCRSVLQQYHEDPTASYPDGRDRPQLMFRLRNPRASNPHSNRTRQAAQRQRLYDRAAQILGVSNPEERARIYVGVHHFRREVIEHYHSNPRNLSTGGSRGRSRGNKPFIDYLLPANLAGNDRQGRPRLGREFTLEDRFDCLGTNSQQKSCAEANQCLCDLYMNLPFVTLEAAKAQMGQKVVVHFANAEDPVAKKLDVIDGARVKRCASCSTPRPREDFSKLEWVRNPGTGECNKCAKARKRVPDDMDMYEVTVPSGVKPQETFAVMVNGWKLTLTCPPNAGGGMKVRFHLPKDPASASLVRLVPCKSCGVSKPRGDFNSSQFKRSGGQCLACQNEEIEKSTGVSVSDQMRNLQMDNFLWKRAYEAAEKEKAIAVARCKEMEAFYGLSWDEEVARRKQREAEEERLKEEDEEARRLRANRSYSKPLHNPDGTRIAAIKPKRLPDGKYEHPDTGPNVSSEPSTV